MIWPKGSAQSARANLASRRTGDIARLYDFLAPVSANAARRSAAILKEAANLIAENPGIGKSRAEFREWPAKFGRSSYILRYLILSKDEVLITRGWHSRELRAD